MKLTGKMRLSALAGTAILSTLMMVSAPGEARADWIQDMMHPDCDPAISGDMAAAIRTNIENSVKRAEASIQAAIPTADLSCLNDLMNAPLDIFSNIGGIMGNLTAGFSGALSGAIDQAGNAVTRQVCQFAQDKWNEVTGPLTGGLADLSIPSITDAFTATDGNGNSYFNNPGQPTNTGSGAGQTDVIPPPIVPDGGNTGDAGLGDSPSGSAAEQVVLLQQALQCYAYAQGDGDHWYSGQTFNTRLESCLASRGITDLGDVLGWAGEIPVTGTVQAGSYSSAAALGVSPGNAITAPDAPAAARAAAAVSPEAQIWNMLTGAPGAPAN